MTNKIDKDDETNSMKYLRNYWSESMELKRIGDEEKDRRKCYINALQDGMKKRYGEDNLAKYLIDNEEDK